MKDKNHEIISTDAVKALNNIQHPFLRKNSQRTGYRGNVPQHNKGHL